MDYKKTKAPTNTVTRDIMNLCNETGNIYESDEISNASGATTKACLDCFRR